MWGESGRCSTHIRKERRSNNKFPRYLMFVFFSIQMPHRFLLFQLNTLDSSCMMALLEAFFLFFFVWLFVVLVILEYSEQFSICVLLFVIVSE